MFNPNESSVPLTILSLTDLEDPNGELYSDKYQVIKPFDEFQIGDIFEQTPDGYGITSYFSCSKIDKDSHLVPIWILTGMPEYFQPVFNNQGENI